MPFTDQVLPPPKNSFKSISGVQAAYGYYSVALHECSHSTSSGKRMARSAALSKRWGDEAYALEELTVEISAACAWPPTPASPSHTSSRKRTSITMPRI